MTTSADPSERRASRRRRLTALPATVGAIVGLTATALLAAPAGAAPPPVPGAGTYTVEDVNEVDFGNDGTIDQSTTVTKTFDRKGRVLSQVSEDRRPDGTVSLVVTTTWEYDRQGKTLASTTDTDYEGDQVLDARQQVRFAYDRSGRLVQVVQTYDNGADGVDVLTTTYTVTSAKKPEISSTTESDYDGDGVPDERTVETTTFDQRGNAVLETSTTDNRADGSIEVERRVTRTFDKNTLISELDEEIRPFSSSSLTTYTYDRKGQLTGVTETFEPSGYSIVTTFSFDARGVFTGSTRLTDGNGDGVVDEEVIETVESDDQGRPVVRQVDTFGNGDPYRETTMSVYEDDFLVDETTALDRFIDGVPENIERRTWVIADGRVVELTYTNDEGGDGIVDYLLRTTTVYDDRGEVISSVTETDQDGDGVIDVIETQTRTVE